MNISTLSRGSQMFCASKNSTITASPVKAVSSEFINNELPVNLASSPDYHVDISYEAKKLMNIRGLSEDEQSKFVHILEKASSTGGYSDPKHFLNSLTSSEIETIQNVHGLANGIDVQSLDNEGAFNLLVMPYDYVDINNDGIYKIGVGKNRAFPPPSSSNGIVEAWNKAKDNINASEGFKQIISTAPFRAAEISANLHYDENGKLIGVYSPDNTMYTDIYKQPGFNWLDFIDNRLTDLENNQTSIGSDNFSLTKDFLNKFKDTINLINTSEA